MIKRKAKYIFILTLIATLTSCDFSKVSNENLTYKGLDKSTIYKSYTPSIGDINILVVPIEFNDVEPFTNEKLININLAFNGDPNNNNETTYWESVKSYYDKSSYHNLNFNFDIADTFSPSISSLEFVNLEKNGSINGTNTILDELYYKLTINNKKVDYQDYDNDLDGYVDGVWLIYNAGTYRQVYNQNYFWAYTAWRDLESNKNKPVINSFANCSQIFLNEGRNSNGVDTHTLIHETGHLLGLDDYYSYDGNVSPSGGKMMMDLNIGDHDSYSKYALGWVKPEIIKNEGIYTLRSFTETGDFLLIPSESYYDNPFGEYLLIEFYTPTSLNSLDSQIPYGDGLDLMYQNYGIIIYHIDARLIEVNYNYYNYLNLYEYKLPNSNSNRFIQVGSSNTESYSATGYSLITLISNEYRTLNDEIIPFDNTLFYEGDSFSFSSYEAYFPNSQFNDGSSCSYNIEITNINEDSAIIRIS